MLRFSLKLVSSWKLLTNATKSNILAVTMVLDISLCFFRKPSNATSFIIYFNMYSQTITLWKKYHVQRERDDNDMKICKFWGRELMSLSLKDKQRVRKFSFSHGIILGQNYIVIFISLSLVNSCQNYIELY